MNSLRTTVVQKPFVQRAWEEAKLAELKQQAAEERQAATEKFEKQAAEALWTFCHATETEVFPTLMAGERVINELGAFDIPSFKAAISRRIAAEAAGQVREMEQRLEGLKSSRMAAEEAQQAREAHLSAAQAAAESQDQKLKDFEDQMKVKGDELTQAKAETSIVQLELNEQKTSSSKLSEELEKSKKDLEESRKRLADAEALLQAKCALWAQDPEDPHMLYATPAEHEILWAEQAEEEAERQELEAEQRAAEAQARAQPASSAAGTETSPGLDPADQPDPPAEA
ncbi:uncharacterized protein LOC110715153 [Chenopodium quinoa]|uniref:uncharacterized protein LOC110715153 n=1 Tax=Chenopodium quinoa TaxID=63459 RepID=UPI000B7973A8|nr:uncharacterized protein LOC110715153 [Chenopodium quinoa]